MWLFPIKITAFLTHAQQIEKNYSPSERIKRSNNFVRLFKGTVKKIGLIFFREKKLWMASLLLILYDFVHLEVSSVLPTSVQPLEVEILKFYTG